MEDKDSAEEDKSPGLEDIVESEAGVPDIFVKAFFSIILISPFLNKDQLF